MTVDAVLDALRAAGTAQNRKVFSRYLSGEPVLGVSFAFIATMVKRIGVDHELARALWETGIVDARTLALKIADPARVTPAELDRWAAGSPPRMCGGYVAMLAAESPHGRAAANRWLASSDPAVRRAGWALAAQLASRDAGMPDAWFEERLAAIEGAIHGVDDRERESMNGAIIAIGGRSAGLRAKALAAAKRIGPLDVDHGDTHCKTPAAGPYIEKMWAHAKARGFPSPTAQESARKPPRLRC